MELYHSTNQEIQKISKLDGRFGEFLFFGNESSGQSHGDIIYKIEIDESEIIRASSIFYEENACKKLKEIILEVMELCDCDKQTAMNYLDESETFEVVDQDSAEISWNMQLLTAKAAKKLGYKGVAIKDEHGISWMIDMFEKENELMKIE